MARSGGGNPQRYFPETASIHIFYNDRIWRCKIWFRLRDGRISPSRGFSNIEISCLQRPVRAAPYRYFDFQKIDSANFLNYRKDGIDHRSPDMVSIIGIYQWTPPMAKARDKTIAKLFMHGRSQAVRLPKAFRLPGREARVSKVGDKVILEPMGKPPFDVKAWRARLDALGAADFLPEGLPDDAPVQPDRSIAFD
jgi:antitoxin VapB